MAEIDIFKVLDFIRDNAPAYAQAKADRVYLEQFRKTKKALLFQQAPSASVADREAYAYSHPEYQQVLDGIRVAVEEEARLFMLIEAAKLKADVWRTIQSDKRAERII